MENLNNYLTDTAILYSCPLIRYCTIMNKWDYVCMRGLSLKHPEQNQLEVKDLEKDYFLNTSEILEEQAKQEDEGKEEGELEEALEENRINELKKDLATSETNTGSTKSTININKLDKKNTCDNQESKLEERRLFRDNCDSLNLDSEILIEDKKGKIIILIK